MSVPAIALAWAMMLPAQPANSPTPPPAAAEVMTRPMPEKKRHLPDEVEANLKNQILAKWYPRAVDDTGGGFFQNYIDNWSPGRAGAKASAYESRLPWAVAQAAMRFPEQAAMYSAAARHGLNFLANKIWDQTNGGFFWNVDDNGNAPFGRGGIDGGTKQASGNGFAIYVAAAVFQLTKDLAALDLAKKGFLWYDSCGLDAVSGGWWPHVNNDGTPVHGAKSDAWTECYH